MAATAGATVAHMAFDRARILAEGPYLVRHNPAKLKLWATELLLTGEPTNDVVRTAGGPFNVLAHTYRGANMLHVGVTLAMLGVGLPNIVDSVARRGPRGLYDDKGGRTGAIGAASGSWTLYTFGKAYGASRANGTATRAWRALEHCSFGSWTFVGPSIVMAALVGVNELGAFANLDVGNTRSLGANLRQARHNARTVAAHPTQLMQVLSA